MGETGGYTSSSSPSEAFLDEKALNPSRDVIICPRQDLPLVTPVQPGWIYALEAQHH